MKTENILENINLIQHSSDFFKDPMGEKIIQCIDEKKNLNDYSLSQFLLKHYIQSYSYKISDLWHHYLFNRLTQFSLPVHEAFYSGFKIPQQIKKEYQENFLIPIQTLFLKLSLKADSIETPEIPYLEERKKIYNALIQDSGEKLYEEVKNFFMKAGAGYFSKFYYYEWNQNIKGIAQYSKKNLNELAGYESQKLSVLENTRKFLNHQPANHVFLYGSRGTGKTSLIKGLLEEFKDQGLRLIKVYRENIEVLPDLFFLLRRRKEKFIINLDDISYDEGELIYKKHKVAIDSFFDLKPENVLLYATSNSQEIVKYFRQETTDNFVLDNRNGEEKKLEMPHRQIYDERRAFTERFGLSVFFGRTDEETADEILAYYLKKKSIKMSFEELKKAYNQWVIYHGAVNGRTIESFIKYRSSF